MPTYVYREILEDGSDGETFEIQQSINEPTLTEHPVTGRPVRRVLQAPNISTRYSEGATKARLDNKRIEAAGFTKYERDKATGTYHKVAGKDKNAPDSFRKPQGD